jgi:formiminoglutamase
MWSGRIDSNKKERFHQCVTSLGLEDVPFNETSKLAFIGFASDEGVKRNQGKEGAVHGPRSIREALGNLPFERKDLQLYDIGDIRCQDGNLEEAQSRLAFAVDEILKRNCFPIVLGGGHEVAWGHFQGISRYAHDKNIAIVNFDAHLDMRPYDQKGSSGTPFRQIADHLQQNNQTFNYTCIGFQPGGNTASLIQTATDFSVKTINAEDLHLNGLEASQKWLNQLLGSSDLIYVTLCLDVFAAPYAPGVSAPQPLGLTPWQVIPLLRLLANSGKVISLDIAEMSPAYDHNHITAKLAAHLIYEFIHQLQIK